MDSTWLNHVLAYYQPFAAAQAASPVAPTANDTEQKAAEDYYKRNMAWAKPAKTYLTTLSPAQEQQFQAWLKTNQVPFDASPQADYDMRGFYAALMSKDPKAVSAIDPNDNRMHYPDYWKTPYHETFSNESQWAVPDKAPKWNDKDQLVGSDGTVIFDDRKANKKADGQ